MNPRLGRAAFHLRNSLWLRPLLLVGIGLVLGWMMPLFDGTTAAAAARKQDWVTQLLASTSAGARSILETSAGALATVAGVIFTITVVTLQLAARQYTSRVLRRFMADRVTQTVLGTIIGTVVYLLVVLRTVEGGGEDWTVPVFSLTFGIVLVILSLMLVAVFTHNVAISIQAATILRDIGDEARRLVGRLDLEPARGVRLPEDPPLLIAAPRSGYLAMMEAHDLADAFQDDGGERTVRFLPSAGDHVIEGAPLLAIWPPRPVPASLVRSALEVVGIEKERTTQEDFLFGIRQIVDIALRALSPSLNESTTALMAVNELGSIVREVLKTGAGVHAGLRCVRKGRVTVLTPVPGLDEVLHECFRELVRNAGAYPHVVARVVEVLGDLALVAGDAARRDAIRRAGDALHQLGCRGDLAPADRAALDARLRRLHDRTLGLQSATAAPTTH